MHGQVESKCYGFLQGQQYHPKLPSLGCTEPYQKWTRMVTTFTSKSQQGRGRQNEREGGRERETIAESERGGGRGLSKPSLLRGARKGVESLFQNKIGASTPFYFFIQFLK